jgi:hypothetical protein
MRGDSGEAQEQNPELEGSKQQSQRFRSFVHTVTPTQRRLAEALVLILSFFFAAQTLWPEYHGGAIISGAVGIAAVLAIELPLRRWAVATLAITVISAAIYWIVGPARVKNVVISGALHAGDQEKNHCESGMLGQANPKPQHWLSVLIGTNAIAIANAQFLPVLAIGNCTVFSVAHSPDGLAIYAKLYDEKGKLIAVVEDNKYQAINGDESSVAPTVDLTEFTILNRREEEIFHVRYLNRNSVQVRGVFGCPGHALVPIKDNEPIPGVFMGGVCFSAPVGLGVGKAFFGVR